jgi:hypothetical protein
MYYVRARLDEITKQEIRNVSSMMKRRDVYGSLMNHVKRKVKKLSMEGVQKASSPITPVFLTNI